jgi:hypothetical protein
MPYRPSAGRLDAAYATPDLLPTNVQFRGGARLICPLPQVLSQAGHVTDRAGDEFRRWSLDHRSESSTVAFESGSIIANTRLSFF